MALRHLAEREQLAGQRAVSVLHPLELSLRAVRHQLVEPDLRQVEVEVARQDGQAALERYQIVVDSLLIPRLRCGPAEDRLDAEQDLARIMLTPRADGFLLDVLVVGLRPRDVWLDGEDRVRVPRGERASLRRRARLKDRRPVLRRPYDVERAARLEERPHVLDPVHLGRIGEDSGLVIHQHSIAFPAAPQLSAHLHGRTARRRDGQPRGETRLSGHRRDVSLLAVRDLSAFYGAFQALFGVSLDVAEGELVAVIGANGAGKTTLLRTLAGAGPRSRGTVEFAGVPVAGLPAEALVSQGLVLVPEGRKIFPSLSVQENLQVGAYRRRPGPWPAR